MTNIATAEKIGTERFPLKNASAVGKRTSLKRLYKAAATSPATIPSKTLLLTNASNAGLTWATFTFVNVAICAGANKNTGNSYATTAAKATAPASFFCTIPSARPTANNNANWPKTPLPAIAKKFPIDWATVPSMRIIQFPIPTNKAAAGKTETGNINERPIRCR